MATVTDYSSNHRSPTGTGFTGDNLNSSEFRRKNHQSPWAQVVRGEQELISPVDQSPLSSSSSLSSLAVSAIETPAPASPPSDNLTSSENYDANDGNATATTKKQAWNKPSNAVVEGGPVMGADSWPALAESARASPKLAVDPPPKPTVEVSVPASQGPVSVPPQRLATNNAKSNPSLKHPVVARQRSSRRGSGGGGGSSMGGPARGFYRPTPPPPPPPPPPPFPVFQIPASSYYNLIPAIPDPSSGEPLFRSSNWDPRAVAGFVPQTNFATDHRNFFPRGNLALHPRGDGHYRNNHGGKRDQDRGIYSNARDAHFQQHRPPTRGFMRPLPPYTAQFPLPVRPHGNPMPPEFVYVPTLPLEPYRGMPFVPRPSMYYPAVDPTLSAALVQQIEYYFSDGNLISDGFLRSKMDDQGWVPISLIARFPKVQDMTNNIQWIVESLRTSTVLEVQDNRIRKRNEWKKWTLNSNLLRTDLAFSTPSGSGHDSLTTSFRRVRMDEGTDPSMTSDSDPQNTKRTIEIQSSESADRSQLANGEMNQDVQTDI